MSIRFVEDGHLYLNDRDERYISVSELIKKLEHPVDWNLVAKNKSKSLAKEGIIKSAKELLAEWENKRLKGSGAGTIYHKIREDALLATSNLKVNNVSCGIIPCTTSGGYKYSLKEEKLQNNTVYPEAMIYDHSLKLCGQSDKVIVVNNTIHVEDYKTDEAIERRGWSNKWNPPKKLLPPVDHLNEANYWTYSLKMSTYMYMLWMKNKHLRVGDLVLEHVNFKRDEEGIPILDENNTPQVIKVERIKVPYLKKEVIDIFDWYKKGKLN